VTEAAVTDTPAQIYQAAAARPNRDAFDALICAAARHLELALLTRDGDIRQSGLVRVIW
jgi:predicted nucleic acid-binding protein